MRSIIADQLEDMVESGCSAVELTEANLTEVARDPPQFLFCSTETALSQQLKSVLMEKGELFNNLEGIAVDESHVVETWTGKR